MKNKRSLIETILAYRAIIIIGTVLLIGFGTVALLEMPRDEFPKFTIRQGLIVGVYPGASSEQVEQQLTKKVENYLFQYEAVDKAKTYSVSKENIMVIYVEIDPREKDPDAFWAKLRHGLNELKGSLPGGVLSLTADNDFGNTSAMLLSIESNGRTYRELEDYIGQFNDDVRKIPSVSRIKCFGMQPEQISVYIDDAKLTNYGIKPLVLLTALKSGGSVAYAGEIDNGQNISPIHLPLTYKTETDIANQIVYSDPAGGVVRVKDVARVVREYPDPDSYIRTNGKKAIIISLEMRPGNNIVQFGKDVDKAIGTFKNRLPADVEMSIISNMPGAVSHAILDFLKEFGIAILSVILVTVFLLPRRVALVAAATIPISIMITLGIMWMSNIDLQTVSLAGLIIVLGMVVDNAIVIIDNYVEKLDTGISPLEAASKSVTDLFGSVFLATLIIISFFGPMAYFMTGVGKDFIISLPLTIAYALIVSLGTAALLVPMMSYVFIKIGLRGGRQGKKAKFLEMLQRNYDHMIEISFANKWTVLGIGLLSFIAGLYLLLITPQQSFPQIDRNQFAVEIYLPEGSSLARTDTVMKTIENKLLSDKRVKVVSAFIGTSSPRFNTIYAPNFPAKHYGQLVVLTESNEATIQILDEYSKKYSDCYPDAYIKWKQLDFVAAKAPIEIRISGDSIETLKKTAESISAIARQQNGVAWVRTDYERPVSGVSLQLKNDEAARLGYSNALLSYSIMTGSKGFPISTMWEGDYPVNVSLLVDKKVKTDIEDILNQNATSAFMLTSVPIRQLVNTSPEWTEGEIVRRNGVRTITVRVDVDRGVIADLVFKKILKEMGRMKLPEGQSLSYGGEREMSVDNFDPLQVSMLVSIVLTFLILLVHFRKIKTVFVIMLTMPLSLFGASLGVFITGYPFSVTAFIGLIGLMGIVVRNGIILVTYAEELREKNGMTVKEAALASGKRRMRPIFLTSAAAAVGVVPMIMSRSSLWGPLGSVICFGVIFGMILSLLLLPVLYYLVNNDDEKHKVEGAAL